MLLPTSTQDYHSTHTRLGEKHNKTILVMFLNSMCCVQQCAGSIMDMKVQGSRSGKALGIGELFASVCRASAPLDRS